MHNNACNMHNIAYIRVMNDPKDLVKEIIARVGKHGALRLLINQGVGTSTAEKLVRNRYSSEMGQLLRQAVEQAYRESMRQVS